MSTSAHSRRSAMTTVVAAVLLLILLLGLGAFYWYLSRPPQVREVGEKDRNYLFSIYGFEGDLLRRPSSVAVGPEGDIYVADTGKKRIVVFNRDGEFLTSYGNVGEGETDLWEPLGVAVAPDGRSFVVEKSKKKLVLFDAQNQPIKAITLEEYPLSARVADDLLFVTTESGVLIADLDGNLQTGYIKRGKKPGEFDRPGSVAVGPDGTLFVADSLNYRVQAIGTDGKPKWQYGEPLKTGQTKNMTSDTGQKFGLPASIAADDRYLYVVDGLNSEVVVLAQDTGELIERMGDVGHDDGKFYYPDGIDYADGRLVIADKYNDRVEVFSVPTASTATRWLPFTPWLFLLLLLPLPLLLLLRRGPRYVMSPAFLARLEADETNGAPLAEAIKRAWAIEPVVVAGKSAQDLSLDWHKADAATEDVRALAERFALDESEAATLAVSAKMRGKRALLVSKPEGLAAAAEELGIPTLTYASMLERLLENGTNARSDVQEADAGGTGEGAGDADA